MGLGVTFWVGLAAAADPAAPCAPLADALEAATLALIDGADAGSAFAAAEVSLACAPATAPELARLFVLRGAALQLGGEPAAAEPFYAAARGQDDAWFDDRLGAAVRAAWSSAKHGDPGRLTANRPLTVDGAAVEAFPATLESGPHALQALDVAWARVLVLPPGEELAVDVPLTPPPPAAVAGTRRRGAGWLVAGGAALAGAIGCGAAAVGQTEVMGEADTVAALDDAWGAQQALGYTAIGLGVVGAAGVTLHFVLP